MFAVLDSMASHKVLGRRRRRHQGASPVRGRSKVLRFAGEPEVHPRERQRFWGVRREDGWLLEEGFPGTAYLGIWGERGLGLGLSVLAAERPGSYSCLFDQRRCRGL